jgi:transketolase
VRTTFVNTLFELAQRDPRIVLITGDLGFGVIERFMQELPDQFVNAGVAEQNMTGLATGMALSGKVVFTYSIANFPTLRCLEQIRNDVCYHQANVKVVAVGGGFAYGSMGATHFATEDLGVMRMLPNMLIVAPGDPVETRHATRAVIDHTGPCYVRLGKAGEPTVHAEPIEFVLGKAIRLRDGADATLISTGGMLRNTLAAAELLEKQGIRTRVLSMHTLKPLDEEAVIAAARDTGAVFTVEEHSITGGLGTAVAEVLAEHTGARGSAFKRLGVPPRFAARVGSQEFMLAEHGLTPPQIADSVNTVLGGTLSTRHRQHASHVIAS